MAGSMVDGPLQQGEQQVEQWKRSSIYETEEHRSVNPLFVEQEEQQYVPPVEEEVQSRAPVSGLQEVAPTKFVTDHVRHFKTGEKDSFYSSKKKTDNLPGLYRELTKSKKFSADNESYRVVKETMGRITDRLGSLDVRGDLRAPMTSIAALTLDYKLLIEKSSAYLESHPKPFSNLGKHRRYLMSVIKQFAETDSLALIEVQQALFAQRHMDRSTLTFGHMMQEAKLRDVVDGRDETSSSSTGLLSEVMRVDFKATEEREAERRYFKVSKPLYGCEIPELTEKEKEGKSEQRQWYDRVTKMYHKLQELNEDPSSCDLLEKMQSIALVDLENGQVDIDKRNVASSIVAKLLGFDRIIAKSEFSKHITESQGTRFGILMEEAKGINGEDLLTQTMQVRQDLAPEVMQNFRKMMKDQGSLGAIQRDLTTLQVLDNICGQLDRHINNFKIEVIDGKYVGMKGIDNDLAFGKESKIPTEAIDKTHVARIQNQAGEPTLPYVSRELATNIIVLAQQADVLDLALAGLISQNEIEALKTRLRTVAVLMQKMKESGKAIEDDAWTPEVMAESERQSAEEKFGNRSYFARYQETILRHSGLQ